MPDTIPETESIARRSVICMALLVPIVVWSAIDIAVAPDASFTPPPALRGVNPNTAPWWELAALPRIGHAKAVAVTRYRKQERKRRDAPSENAPPPIFNSADDLEAVRGIGPRTVQRLADHLRLPSADHYPSFESESAGS